MKLTNELKYPESVYNAALDSIYKPLPDKIRVTELISPPLIRTLTMRHWDDIVVDVDDFLLSMFGTAFHKFLASYENKDNTIFGQRFDVKVGDYVLTGEPDKFNVNTGILEDYKTTSAWSFVFGHKEWEEQLNLYAHLLRLHGYKVYGLLINAFLRDWTLNQSRQRGRWDYPDKRFYVCRMKLWDLADTEKFIDTKITDIITNPERECTPEEKWEHPTTYAVMKDGRKNAVRVLKTNEAALDWIEHNTKGAERNKITIDVRQGECVRCNGYCDVSKFCPYFKGDNNERD
jgi:hypothetical protein